MRLDRLAYKFESISALAGTGCQYSPDAFAPKPAVFATSALCNIAVYNNKPNSLFSEIIGRLNTWCCDKSEISFTVFTKTICKILSLTTVGNINQHQRAACISNLERSFNVNRPFNNFNLLNNFAGVFNLFKFAADQAEVLSQNLVQLAFCRVKKKG